MDDEPKLTLSDLADDDTLGGHWAKAAPASLAPASLPVPAWSRDLAAMPPEPPLGVNVHEVPDLGLPEAPPPAAPAQPEPKLTQYQRSPTPAPQPKPRRF